MPAGSYHSLGLNEFFDGMSTPTTTQTRVIQPSTGAHRFAPAISSAGVAAAAVALAGCIELLQGGQPPEKAVLNTGILLAAILAAAPGIYVLRKRSSALPGTAGLAFLTACGISLLAIYFFWVSSYVFFPADFLIWSEGDFLNDILKFSVGYPLYSPQVNNDSLNYVPGAQLLTYLLVWIAGKTDSIPAYRIVQVGYAAIAAFIATLCCRRMLRLAFPEMRIREGWLWDTFWYAALLLIATNSITNHFVHNLHADALAEVANLASFYLLLRYMETPSRGALAAMVVMVPVGFFIRQNALIWAVCYFGFLAVWGRSWKRLAVFTAATAALYGAAIAICYVLWGEPFFYWVFSMLTKHALSPLRSFEHLLDAWAYFAALLLGGAAVLRGRNADLLLGAWLASLLVLVAETYTTGIAWTLNHMGPGSLLAGVWFLAGLTSVWDLATGSRTRGAQDWIRAGALTATVALMFSGWGVIRIPLPSISEDAYRYVRDIEKEFQGQAASQILLDEGTWVYWKQRVIMGDRSPGIGERGSSGAGDFSGILSRLAAKRYSKILVRDYHAPDFAYEYYLWPKPSGIRQAMLDNYREVGRIRAAEGPPAVKDWAEDPYFFGEITILEPKTNSPAP